MSTRNGRIAAIAIAAFVGVTPVLTASAAFAKPPPKDSTDSGFPGGCVDMRTGTDYPNGDTRTDDHGTIWKCKDGKWYTTVSATAGHAGARNGNRPIGPTNPG